MNESQEEHHSAIEHVKDHRYLLLIFGSIGISVLLVLVALSLYVSSGASQLDLSRPGYASIRSQVDSNDTFAGYSSSGDIDKSALNQFNSLYIMKLTQVTAVDAFGNDVLSPEALQIDQKSALQGTR